MKAVPPLALAPALLAALLAGAAAAGPVVVPGENLVAEGVPPIPSALADQVLRYTEVRRAALADWHPLRREMLVLTRFGAATQAHVVRQAGGARTQLTFLREPIAFATWHPDGGCFLFGRDTGGDERYQIYRCDQPSGAITLLTDGQARNTGPVWSRRGDRVAYRSTRRNGRDADIWILDPLRPGSDRLAAEVEGGGWEVLDWSPDDDRLLLREEAAADDSRLWLLSLATGARAPVAPTGPPVRATWQGGRFAPGGRAIWTVTDRGGENLRLARLDLETGELRFLTDDIPWDVEAFAPSWDGRTLAAVTNEDGVSVLRLLEARTGRALRAPALPPGVVTGLRWHRNDRDLGFTYESAGATGDVWVLDTHAGRLERWTASETGGIVADELPPPEVVRWPAPDGRLISGLLYRPPPRFAGPRPVIVNIHGGPEGQARPLFQTRLNYFLLEEGVAVLYPNVRGSTGYGRTFAALDNGLRREDAYRDVGALLDWLATAPGLDAGRVLVMGASYGGHLTLAVAALYPGRIRCAMDYCGISHLATFLENTAPYRRDLRRAEYGDERDPELRAFMDRTAPLNNAGRIRCPLLVVQGGNDPRVPPSEAEQIRATLRASGTPVWSLLARDEGHGFAKKDNNDFLTYTLVLFARQYLLAP